MNKRELSVRDEAIAASKETPEEFRARILLAAAVKLYEVGRGSSGVVARIAGIPGCVPDEARGSPRG